MTEVWDMFGGELAGCMNESDPECEEKGTPGSLSGLV